MDVRRTSQFNVRSPYLRERVPELAAELGMTSTQVLEEAVRAFASRRPDIIPDGLERVGKFLVGHTYNRQLVTLEEANKWIELDRSGDRG